MTIVRGSFALLVVSSSAAIACSLGALDGFSSGGPPAPADAATTSSGDGGGPAPGDAGGDGGTTATDAAAPDGGFDCAAGVHLFCTTFDDGMLARGWDMVTTRAGGTVALDGDARSAPFAMRAQLPAQSDATDQYARLAIGFPGTRAVRVSFDVKLAAITFGPTDKAVALFEIDYAGTANSSYLFRARDEMTVSAEQNGAYAALEALPYDKWTRVALEIVPTSPTGRARVTYDGRTVYENTSVPFDPPAATSPRTDVFIGLVRYDPPAPPIDARYDNVTIDALP